MGLGLALLVVVVVVLVAGGGALGQPSTSGSAAAPTAASLDTARVRTLQAAAQANPKDVESRIELGNIYYDAGRYIEATGWYSQALALTPNDTNVRTDLATSYYYTGDTPRAIEEGRKVLAIDGTKVQTLLNMGIWLNSLSPPNTAEALKDWQLVVSLYPGTDVAKQAQGFIDKYKN
ncbi:MAG: tetratricopeptide repeat protein [Chloroflexota bacterium]|nr:tetratricopeptide repeat protein [Chloroflexota bacterium]